MTTVLRRGNTDSLLESQNMKEKTYFAVSGWPWAAGAAVFGFAVGLAVSGLSPDVRVNLPLVPAGILNAGTVTEAAPSQDVSHVAPSVDELPKAAESPTVSLQNALATGDLLERRHNLERLGVEWANADVDAALAALAEVTGLADRTALIRGIFHSLSGREPKSAVNAVLRLEGASDRLAARQELIAAWAPGTWVDDPKRNAYLVSRYGSGGLGMQLLLVSPAQDELAVLWANSLEPEEGKVRLLTEIADGFVFRKSPAEALKLGEGLEGEDYVSFIEGFAGSYAKRDGKAALDWSLQIADPILRENIQQSINSTWVNSDLGGAKAHLLTLPPGPVRESLLSAIASRLGSTDTAAAFAWLAELAAPADQSLAQHFIQSVAPVGIGTQLSMKEGLPVITSLVPGAAAELSQQVQPGDRIVGVDAYGDGFVSTNGMDLEKVADLIRGRPGTSVRLQVSKVNAHGFDPPRVMVLPRSQVFLTPGK